MVQQPLFSTFIFAATYDKYLFQCDLVLNIRGRKVLENRQINDDERIQLLEKELEETIMLGEEADRKYEEVTA